MNPPTRRQVAIAALLALTIGALLTWRNSGTAPTSATASASAQAPTAPVMVSAPLAPALVTASGAGSAESLSRLSRLSGLSRDDLASAATKRARDAVVMAAVHRFQTALAPTLDLCLGAGPMRVPRQVIVDFQRELAGALPGADRFVAARLRLAPQRDPSADSGGAVARCLDRLVGQPLAVETGSAPVGDSFRQVITMLLPATLNQP